MNGFLFVKAPAKVNLFLRIVSRRPDGYHELHTLFQKVGLFDEVRVDVQDGKKQIHLECAGIELPSGPGNLAYRAAQAFLARTGLELDVKIRLHKRIPVGAGLGGGSSDAAAVINCLNNLSKFPLSLDELMDLALELGADVPFFVSDAPAAVGRGIGEILEPHTALPSWFLLVWPGFAINTRWVYSNLELTTQCHETIFSPGHNHETAMWINDLEKAVIRHYPEILNIKKALLDLGAEASLMSGSGSMVFGLFYNREDAVIASRSLVGLRGSHFFKTYVVKGLE